MRFKVMLLTVLTLFPVLTAALRPTYFISAPNVIRVGVDETIVINICGAIYPDAEGIPVTVKLQDYPARTTTYATRTVNVNKTAPTTVTLQVRPQDFVTNINHNEPEEPQYVHLHASSEYAKLNLDAGTQVLLSYRSGYTFIQTDKPIYTPNQKVYIRLVSVNQQMRPSQDQVRVEILTPQGVIVKRFKDKQPDAGFVLEDYTFPPAPAFGNWTVVAYYGHEMKHNTSVQFLVKEYVLPTFSVKVTVKPTEYIISSSQRITTLVQGRYVFGENVQQGYYRIKYSLMDADGSLKLIKDVNNNETLNENGESVSILQMEEILMGQDFDDFIGKRLHIEAFVVEAATGKLESTNNTVLEFVNSPFRFNWDQTLKYFKAGMAFEVKADVVFCYGVPAPDLPVRINAVGYTATFREIDLYSDDGQLRKTTNRKGQVRISLNVPPNIKRIVVTMTTVAEDELANFQKTDTFEIQQFIAPGNNQLLIKPSNANEAVLVSNTIEVNLQRSGGQEENLDAIFTYIVAGGKILQAKNVINVISSTTTDLYITQGMVPSARMVAFYVNDANQVVADAIWIDVEDQCENPVEVTVQANPNRRTDYMPGETVTLTLTGKQQTKVGLLAVDSAVYQLQDYHRLNKKKMFARMASYDLGCGPGGGRDTQDIFKNAGISIITNAVLQTERREDLGCNEHNRRRRSIQGADYNLAELKAKYESNDTLTVHCIKGAKIVAGFSCQERRDRLTNPSRSSWKGFGKDHPYMVAFFQCCLAFSQDGGRSVGDGQPTPPKLDFTHSKVQIRSDFSESWLINYPLVNLNDQESVQHHVTLPGSITTWIIQAVGVSPLYGMCVADNKEIVARRDCFLDVAVPYSVMRQEQVAIVATVYNYKGDNERVNLQMEGVDGLCSNAIPGEFVIEEGEVAAGKAKSFTFIVIPLEVNDFIITIYMFANQCGNDAVRKTLHVVPEGTPQVQPLSIVIDPAGIEPQVSVDEGNQLIDHGQEHDHEHRQLNDQVERQQIDIVKLAIPVDAVPSTAQCAVSIIGSLLGPVADAVINGLDNDKFLNMPTGCGEQTMIYMAPNVYIFKYLISTGQDTPEVEEKAIKFMNEGYSREINNFRTADGAFKTFSYTPGNSWLTAFVLRVFCHAKEHVFIDDKVICKGMEWLSSVQNIQDGSFPFTHRTYDAHLIRGGVDEPIPLTAFVLIALSECNCATMDTTQAVSRATIYLEGKLQDISQDPHTLAIATYALALVRSAQVNSFNTQLKTLAHASNAGQRTMYFGTQASGPLTVETTAYALLAQIQLGEITYSYPIVLWLLSQRDQIGNWYSTQDTMVALQALSEYSQRTHTEDIDLSCAITSSVEAKFQQHWKILPENTLVLQAIQHAPVEGNLVFTTTGFGRATLSVNLHYNKATGDRVTCPFNITVTPRDEEADAPPPGIKVNEKPKKKISITVCAKYLGEGKTNMAIIDVGLLSGFSPIRDTLQKAIDDVELAQMYEVSDRSVIFYLDEIPGWEPLCMKFEAHQDIEVGNVQPVPVNVYDYYLPNKTCTKFYRPDGGSPVLETLCRGDVCECAATKCVNMDPEVRSDVGALKNMACQSTEHFVYKTTAVEKQDTKKDSTFDIFIMEVTPLKKGSDQAVQKGQHRQFWKSANCEHPIIEEGNDYLIVGEGGIPLKDDVTGEITGYRHFVDSTSTVIHWPSEEQFILRYRSVEKNCKNACPKGKDNRNCKVGCIKKYRPIETENRNYFGKVELEFRTGCKG